MALLSLFLVCGSLQDLESILRGFDSEDPAMRDEAAGKLEAFVRGRGEAARPALEAARKGAGAEVAGRLRTQLEFLDALAACRKSLEVFERAGLPPVAGKTLVLFNTGRSWTQDDPPRLEFATTLGWAISESEQEITLLWAGLREEKHARDRKLPEDWEKHKAAHPKGLPLPGERVEIDFRAALRVALGREKVERDDQTWKSHVADPSAEMLALLARWALERGVYPEALELVAAAREKSRERREKESFVEWLAADVAETIRSGAVRDAHGGLPRPELAKRWRLIAELGETALRERARRMAGSYEKMAEEDRAWKDPGAEAARKMPAPERAAYWLHRLRDLAASQMSDPGSCLVLGPWTETPEGQLNAADELVAMGWDALPAVIEHLDDDRPTRSIGWHRRFNPGSFYLLHVGDCCQQVFEAITGHEIYRERTTSSAMVKDGEAPESKVKAEKWWQENGSLGAEGYFLKVLEKGGAVQFAAGRLLKLDKAKHLDRLAQFLKGGDAGRQEAVLAAVQDQLEPRHQGLVKPLLGHADLRTVVGAARTLWRLSKDDAGVGSVSARLGKLNKEEEEALFWIGDSILGFLASVGTEAAETARCELMRSPVTRLRMEALESAGKAPSPRTAERLVATLEDRGQTGWSSGFPLRWCDLAARSLLRIAGLPEKVKYEGSEQDRERVLDQLREWWKKNRESIDWTALRKK